MLQYIIWSDALSVGKNEIDEQHLQIVDIINQLYEAKQEQSLVTPRHVMDLLKRYTETHFSYEEELMREAGYPEVEGHIRYHSWMAGRTRELALSVTGDPDSLTEDVFDFLKEWWLGHIKNADRMYAPYIKKYQDERRSARGGTNGIFPVEGKLPDRGCGN